MNTNKLFAPFTSLAAVAYAEVLIARTQARTIDSTATQPTASALNFDVEAPAATVPDESKSCLPETWFLEDRLSCAHLIIPELPQVL